MTVFGLMVGINSTEVPELNTFCAPNSELINMKSLAWGLGWFLGCVNMTLLLFLTLLLFFKRYQSLPFILKRSSVDFPVHLFQGMILILRSNIALISSRKSWPGITATGEFRRAKLAKRHSWYFQFLIPLLCFPGLWQMKYVVLLTKSIF